MITLRAPRISEPQTPVCNLLKSISLVCLLLTLTIANSHAEVGIDIEHLTRQGVDDRLQSDGVGLLGDQIDPSTGAVVFHHTDVAIPGNSALEVAFRRTRSTGRKYIPVGPLADWEIETPKISVMVAQTRSLQGQLEAPSWFTGRCTMPQALGPRVVYPPPVPGSNPFNPFPDNIGEVHIIEDHEYSNGVVLDIPGQGSRQILHANTGGQWPAGTQKVTTDNWAIKCILATDPDAPIAGGEGFIAIAPNGDQYKFNQLFFRTSTPIEVGLTALERSYAIMFASEVTDVNGNWVRYEYDSAGKPTKIHSNDGRVIDISYTNNLVSQITANPAGQSARAWSYAYSSVGLKNLTTVTLPDGRNWSLDLRSMDNPPNASFDCAQGNYTISVTHPNGATGNFTFAETRHLKGTAPYGKTRSCYGSSAQTLPYFDAMSLTQKTLSGPGYPLASWSYTYSGYPGGGVPSTKWTQVFDPLGRKIIHTFHRGGNFEVMPQKVEIFANAGAALPSQTVDYSYLIEAAIGTTYLTNENQNKLTKPRRNSSNVITRGTDTFTTVRAYSTNQASTNYSHGFPTQVTRSSNGTAQSRFINTVFAHNRTKWVLGLAATVSRNGTLFDSYTYDSLGRLTQYNAFGSLSQKFGYHTASGQKGLVAWIEDGLPNPRRTNLSNYKRGLPRQIVRPDNSAISRVVDDNGWVTQETDANGNQVSYQYNPAGWLTLVNRAVPWSDTALTYGGLGGSFTQVSTRGSQRVTTYFDSLTRPYLVKTQPLSGGGATSYHKTDFNALGQVTFTSFPSNTSNPGDGTTTTFDELGRPSATAENVAPFATTSYSYLSANRTRMTDPEGKITTHHYYAYGTPDSRELHRIQQPMSLDTYIFRNNFGKQTRIQQVGNHNGYSMNLSQYFYYDSRQRLCRQRTPEGGYTAYGYNAANELTSYAKGASGGSSCSTPSGSSLVTLTYDDLSRPKTTNFSNSGTPDIVRTYDDNGNLLTLNRAGVNWTYTYDSADNPKTEKLQLDGRTYNLAYAYNANGRLIQHTYPGGVAITYTLNGLGQPTKVKNGSTNYASNIVYHVNGNVQSAGYGNAHSLLNTWTARQQPLRKYVNSGSIKAVDQTYAYNERGQITSLTDAADAGNNRVYGYDDLSRLTSATGPWGSGTFTFDPLANLRAKTLGSRSVTVSYNATTNLATQSTDTAAATRTIGHDGRGNVTTLGGMSFSYDMSDQPVSQSGAVTASYTYDGHLKRVKQTIAGSTTYSVYDRSGALVHRDNVTDSKVTNYVPAAGAEVRLENGAVKYTFKDHLGSPVAGTNSSASVSWRERYTPFGEKHQAAAANDDQPGFTGHIMDADTGLTYMQARYYDPVIGRFLSIDPVGFTADQPFMFNRFAYVGNDPVNAWDPSGTQTSFDIRFRQREKALLSGKMSAAEFKAANRAEGKAAIVGLGVAGIIYTGGRSIMMLRGSALANPATTNEIGIAVTEIAAGDAIGPGTLAVTAAALSLADEAAELANTIGRNSVKIPTPGGALRFDLQGATHKGVSTPHVQRLDLNTNPDTGETFLNLVGDDVREMTPEDLDRVREFLKSDE